MLFIGKARIFYDFEIGDEVPYTGTSNYFCDNQYIKEYFPEFTVCQDISLEDIITSRINYSLTPNQFYTIVKTWYDITIPAHRITLYDFKEWFRLYNDTIHTYNKVLNGQTNLDTSIFLYRKLLGAADVTITEFVEDKTIKTQLSKEVRELLYPEYSLMVEDCLACRLQKKASHYEDIVNKTIAYNVNKYNDYNRMIALVNETEFTPREPINIMTAPTITMEDVYSPYPQERIRTNILYLQTILRIFSKLNGESNEYNCCI